MTTTITIRIDAAEYADHDDCLTAAAEGYRARHGLAAYEVREPRWEDGQRDGILIDMQGRYVVYVIDSPECDSIDRDRPLFASQNDREAEEAAEYYAGEYPYGCAILDTETGEIDYGVAVDD